MLYLSVSLAAYLSIYVATGFSQPWTTITTYANEIGLSLYRKQYIIIL